MAGAEKLWVGGTTAVKQVDTLTIANTWAASDTLTTTLTAEDGSTTQQVQTTAAGSDKTTIRDAHLTALQASNSSLFLQVTWASSGSFAITATAVNDGVPFYCTASETTAGDGTWTRAQTTANAGPNDWNTTGNWDGGVIPVDDDSVKIAQGTYSILYGLDQNAVSLKSLRVSPNYTGIIGDVANSFYLIIDVASTADSNTPQVVLNGRGNGVWLDGTAPTVYITGGRPGANMAQLKGDINDLYVMGANVQGDITIADSMTLDNVYMFNCPGALVNIGSSVSSLDLIDMNAGAVSNESSVASVKVAGGEFTQKDAAAVSTKLEQRGGVVNYWASGTIAALEVYSGLFDLRKNTESALTITSAILVDGIIDERSGLNNVTWSSFTRHHGEIRPDTGSTLTI